MRNHLYTLALHCLTEQGGDGNVSIKLPHSSVDSCEKMAKEICALGKKLYPLIPDWDTFYYNANGLEFWGVHYEQADIGISNKDFVYGDISPANFEIQECLLNDPYRGE